MMRGLSKLNAPRPTYVLVLTYLNQEKSRQTQHENHPPSPPGSTTPGNRSRYSRKKKEKKNWWDPVVWSAHFRVLWSVFFGLARYGSLTWPI